MRKLIATRFILCLIAIQLPFLLSAQWTQQNSGTTNRLNDVQFIDENNGWTVGEDGIFKTIDGGDNWMLWNSTWTSLITIYFINADTGWIAGSYGNVLYTADGGNNWVQQNPGTFHDVLDIYFFNSSLGFAGFSGAGEDGLIKTIDGGTNWSRISDSLSLGSFYFVDQNTGWGANALGIFKTTDGGNQWNQQDTPFTASLFFTDALTAWAAGGKDVYHTSDGGNNWNKQFTATAFDAFKSVYFVDDNTGWVVGYSGTIYHTNDGGNNWAQQDTGATYGLNSLYFTDLNNGWAVGINGEILHYEGNVGIASLNPLGHFKIYQNPTNGLVYIAIGNFNSNKWILEVLNLNGQVIYYKQLNEQLELIDLRNQSKGVYFIKVQTPDNVSVKKLIIN